MKMEWFGFWIFMAVVVACDHWVFVQGYDSLFQTHRTAEEKELQKLKIEELRKKIEIIHGNSKNETNARLACGMGGRDGNDVEVFW